MAAGDSVAPVSGGATSYRIVLRGRITDRMLAPYCGDFSITRNTATTTLTGDVRDPAHLHGIVTHLTGLGLELVSVVSATSG